MLYRVIHSVCLPDNTRYLPGTVSPLWGISSKGKNALLASGVLSEVHSPPLAALPGWEQLAKEFSKQGIENIDQLISADQLELSGKLNIPVEKLEACVAEVLSFIT